MSLFKNGRSDRNFRPEAKPWPGIAGVGILATLYLLTRPYVGIVRDAHYYVVQTLRHLDPATFEKDLFFLHGSQDNFSVFSNLFAPLVQAIGAGQASLLAMALAHTLWAAGLITLSRSLFGRTQMAFAAAAVMLVLPARYGWEGTFAYSEIYLSPRPFAEAMILFGLSAAVLNLRARALALAVLACPIHPLTGLTGLAVIGVFTLFGRLRAAVVAGSLAALIGGGLALLGIEPFTRLQVRMDPEWFDLIYWRQQHAFLAEWRWRAAGYLMMPLAVLLLAAQGPAGPTRHLAQVVLSICAAFFTISLVGADLMRNVLIINLQLWRVIWIALVLGNLLAVPILLSLPAGGALRLALVATIVAAAGSVVTGTAPVALGILSGATLALVMAALLGAKVPDHLARPVVNVLICVAFVAHLLVMALLLPKYLYLWQAVVWLCLAATCWVTLRLVSGQPRPLLVPITLAAVLAVSLGLWDRRDDWVRWQENQATTLPQLPPLGQTVYWEDGLKLLWVTLRRPSFFSCAQSGGVMFFRGTAVEHTRRAEALSVLNTTDFHAAPDHHCNQKDNPELDGPTSRRALVQACNNLPELDHIILKAEIHGAPYTQWAPPKEFNLSVPIDDEAVGAPFAKVETKPLVYHIYDCGNFRQG